MVVVVVGSDGDVVVGSVVGAIVGVVDADNNDEGDEEASENEMADDDNEVGACGDCWNERKVQINNKKTN